MGGSTDPGIDMEECDYCGLFRVLADVGVCTSCLVCKLCCDYVADCACFFKPRPHLMSFRDFKNAARFGSSFAALQAYDRYAESCHSFDRMKNDNYGTDEWKAERDARDRADWNRAVAAADTVVTVLGEAAKTSAKAIAASPFVPQSDPDTDAVDAALEVWDAAGVTDG